MPPLLVKVAPDLELAEMQDIADVVLASEIDGLVIGNTTVDRPTDLRSAEKSQAGGLSGRPLMEKSTACLAEFYRLTEGKSRWLAVAASLPVEMLMLGFRPAHR